MSSVRKTSRAAKKTAAARRLSDPAGPVAAFGLAVRRERLARGLSLRKLAAAVQTSNVAWFGNLEKGRITAATVGRLVRLAEALGMKIRISLEGDSQ